MSIINPKINFFLSKDREEQNKIWDQAVQLFHEKNTVESIKKVAFFLDKDVQFQFENEKHKFQLVQGSVIIYCRITEKTFYAYINVLEIEFPDPIVYRRLLNLNNQEFTSCKASIVKNYIRLTTESLCELASPSKIFWDLYELSTQGDKLDDVLSIYSKGVKELDSKFRQENDSIEKEIQLIFFRKWISEAIENSEYWYKKNDLYVASWWLLGRIFSVIYFIHPEGKLEEELLDIVEEYNNEERSQDENIKRVLLACKRLLEKSDEEIRESFFHGKHTFRTVKPAQKDVIIKYLESSLSSADRFHAMGHTQSEYICLIYGLGMLIVNFSMDTELSKMMIRCYQLAHADYMDELYPEVLRDDLIASVNPIFGRLKILLTRKHTYDLSHQKDLEFIIKRIRDFYENVLDS